MQFTVNRSPHVHKKSREQFKMVTVKTLMEHSAPANALDRTVLLAACKHMNFSGVQMRCIVKYSTPLW